MNQILESLREMDALGILGMVMSYVLILTVGIWIGKIIGEASQARRERRRLDGILRGDRPSILTQP